MKNLLLSVFILFSTTLFGQTTDPTISLLKWLIKKEHIEYLKVKSDAAVFYNKDLLTKQTLVDSSEKDIPNICIKDFLSAEEVQICKTTSVIQMQSDWRKHYSKLKVQFVTDKSEFKILNSDVPYTIYGLSDPIFLNRTGTRVLIGEYLVCGFACGRDDLLLCEFKNGAWQIIARAVIAND